MRILFVSGEDYLPAKVGGAEWSTHHLCQQLQQRSIDVAVFARRKRGYINEMLAATPHIRNQFVEDDDMGYPVFRAWSPESCIDAVIAQFSPSIIIAIAGFAFKLVTQLETRSIPLFLYLRDSKRWLDHFAPGLHYLANSRFIADYHQTRYGIKAAIIQPLVPAEHYRVSGSRTRVVLINPKPQKGVDIFFGLARLRPDIDFEIVECWPLKTLERLRLKSRARALENVRWRRPTIDMRQVYTNAKLVLVPSQWAEAWCRVVTEAHCNGIPVLASNLGGLPESVGNGGILLDHDVSLDSWNEALSEILDTEENYVAYSAAARECSKRTEISVEGLSSRFINTMSKAVKQ